MTIRPSVAIDLVGDQLLPAFRKERTDLDEIDLWYRWHDEELNLPHSSTREHRALAQLAKTPFLGLVVTNVAQALYVDGYRSPEDLDQEGDATPWQLWAENRLTGRQGAIWRAALAYGHAYGTTVRGVSQITGETTAVMRGVSPRKGLAFYADDVEDDWPLYFLRVDQVTLSTQRLRLYDDTEVHTIDVSDTGKLVWLDRSLHGAGVCPVVRFANMLDLDGRTDGEVAPFIPLAKRIKKTIYDRLLTQHFNSWKVRTIAGLTQPTKADGATDEEAATAMQVLLRQGDLLVAEDPDTKFGTLPETSLEGFINATEHDVKMLAAVSQTPVHAMVGDLINLSADALAAARSTLDAKVAERQQSFGSTTEQWLRLGAQISGDVEAAGDLKAHVTWRDTSIRSLASAADALGKFAQMLGIPPEGLWPMIPNVSKEQVEEWRQLARQNDDVMGVFRSIAANVTPAASDEEPAGTFG